MKVNKLPVVLRATGLAVLFMPAQMRAVPAPQNQNRDRQDQDRRYDRDRGDREGNRQFTDRDRHVLMDWYRDNAERFEPRGDERRWNNEELERNLQPGSRLDDETRHWMRPLPDELESRLDRLPSGWRYVRIGYHVCILDRDETIRDVFDFDRFDNRDRDTIQQWNNSHQNAVNQFLQNFGVRMQQGDLDQRLQVGNVVDEDLQSRAQRAPEDLVQRLSPPPRGWRYLVIGDRLILVDRDWRIHESYNFQH